jgi:hypothetical protein
MRAKGYLTGFILFGALLHSAPLYSRLSVPIGADWTNVKRGASAGPVEFTGKGQIIFREESCNIQVADEDETTTEIAFSAISPDGEFRIVTGDVYDSQPAFLVDVKKCGLMHLPLPRYFQQWVSWAPDGQHALFYTDYEASPQLWILDLETDQILEIHRNSLAVRSDSCCGLNEWAPKSGVGYLKPESVNWSDKSNFAFKIEIFCNPYSEDGEWPCDSGDTDHPHAAYNVSVGLNPPKVTSGPRVKLPIEHTAKKR